MVIPAVESRVNVKVERLEAVEKGKWEGNDMTKIHEGWRIDFAGHQDQDGKWDDKVELKFPYYNEIYERSIAGDNLFDTKQEAESSALTLAQQWIDSDGRIPMSAVGRVYFPFLLRIGDRVRSKLSSADRGIIKEGFFSGQIPGAYKVTYEIETEEEMFFMARESDLERLEED